MIDGHDHAISFVHLALDHGLLLGLDLDDLGADLVVLGAVPHEDIGHIVGDLACYGMLILDGYGFAGPFQYGFVVVTKQKKKNAPTNYDILGNLSLHIFLDSRACTPLEQI